MKIAYLILAHTNPSHLGRMIDALTSKNSACFVHIDDKSNIDVFASVAHRTNVILASPRIRVYWAEYSLVEATLTLIKAALTAPESFDYFVLLSGSDFPLRSQQYIQQFFAAHKGDQFISVARIPSKEAGIRLDKITVLRVPAARPLKRIAVKCLSRLGFARMDYTKHLGLLVPYGGSQWWALTREACQYIVRFTEENESTCEFFARTAAPDETIFHTILANSSFAPAIRKNVMFEDWRSGSPHPEMISSEHLAAFGRQEKICVKDAFGSGEVLFARKFSDLSSEIVRELVDLARTKDLK